MLRILFGGLQISEIPESENSCPSNRIFYTALPAFRQVGGLSANSEKSPKARPEMLLKAEDACPTMVETWGR